jgi:prevent-host-death family protein
MSRVIKTTDLHNKTRDVLDWARIDGEEVVVQYFGRPAVVILSFDKYQDYLKYKDEQRQKEFGGLGELA